MPKRVGDRATRYVYEIADHAKRLIYIGLTCNPKKRLSDHQRTNRYLTAIFGPELPFRLLIDVPVQTARAADLERQFIQSFRARGYEVLNRIEGGGIGGTIVKWTRDFCRSETLKFNTIAAFRSAHPGGYNAILRNNWNGEMFAHMVSEFAPNGHWQDKSRCMSEAKQYRTRNAFQRNSGGAYDAAVKNGWYDEVTTHMPHYHKSKHHSDLFGPIR
jgi:predicted GIY-YIG superfamily endonuclease